MWLEIALAAAATLALFVGVEWLVARGLRLDGIKAHLATLGLRLLLATAGVIGVAVLAEANRVALIFTVGATYFAAALTDGALKYRRRPRASAASSGAAERSQVQQQA